MVAGRAHDPGSRTHRSFAAAGRCSWATSWRARSSRALLLPAASLPWQAFALRTPCAVVHDLETKRVFAVAEPDSRTSAGSDRRGCSRARAGHLRPPAMRVAGGIDRRGAAAGASRAGACVQRNTSAQAISTRRISPGRGGSRWPRPLARRDLYDILCRGEPRAVRGARAVARGFDPELIAGAAGAHLR